ncbi:hypothetical protein [Halarcobacter sp.]|uniref:hypothetical protein n=1 Tax=Halarcobacter sp. TaxID=2321133 RepID=UPI0029F4E959|nr:hypothetical protein [Halarcobacter sp.]
MDSSIISALSGLGGASIGGLVSYWVMKENNKHNLEIKNLEFRQKLLVDISMISSKYFYKVHILFNIIGMKEIAGTNIEFIDEKYKLQFHEDNLVYNSRTEELLEIESKLNILNLEEVFKIINTYDVSILEFRKLIAENKIAFPFPDETATFVKDVNKLKIKYYEELQKELKKLK